MVVNQSVSSTWAGFLPSQVLWFTKQTESNTVSQNQWTSYSDSVVMETDHSLAFSVFTEENESAFGELVLGYSVYVIIDWKSR